MDLPLPKRCAKKESDCECIEMAAPGRRFCKRHCLEVERQRERKLAIGVEDSVSFGACSKKKEADCQCFEMAAPGRRFCRKHSLEVKRPDERKRERKLAGGVEDSVSSGACSKKKGDCQCFEMAAHGRRFCRKHSSEAKHPDERKRGRKLAGGEEDSGACSKKMRVPSAEIGKKKMLGRSKEREGDRMKDDLVELKNAELSTRGLVRKGKREGEGLLLVYEIKKGRSNFDEGKKGVAKRKTEEKKRFFGDEVKEPARLNRNSGGSSRAEKSSGVARKRTSPLSKCKDFGGRTAKVESIDTVPLGMGKKSLMCHQCMHSFEREVVVCSNCKTKRYCYPCVAKW